MLDIEKEFLNVLHSDFGKRQNNGICAFCGQEITNKYCTCPGAMKINRFYKKANEKISNHINNVAGHKAIIPPVFEGLTFDDYRTNAPQAAEKQNVLNGVKKYYSNTARNYIKGHNLILIGKWGTGKTMLMSILASNLCADGFNCILVNIVDLITRLKDTFNGVPKATPKQTMDYYKQTDFLFLDDVDKEKPTDFVIETIYNVINYRVEHELPTIISANSSLDALNDMYGEAIVSRFAQNANVIMFTQDNERLK